MARAVWKDTVIAQSDSFELVEGNVYFPPEALRSEMFVASATTSFCPWKGEAHYLTLVIDGTRNQDAAWFYPDPKQAAENIKGHIAFWRGVRVEK